MTLPVLQKIGELVDAGMKVAGVKPEKSPGMSDDTAAFNVLRNKIWANANVSAKPLEEILASLAPRDIVVTGGKAKILYVHRKTQDTDLYWLDNRSDNPNDAEISFRVAGKIPMLWDPETGKTQEVSYRVKDGRTTIPLHFDSWQAYFIVFSGKATANAHTGPRVTETAVASVSTPWTISFQEGRGAPAQTTLNTLASLSENAEPGIKYFSGTAAYANTLRVPAISKSTRYRLDLGDVKNLAEVIVNGKNVGIVWKKPFVIDVTDALKTGDNMIEIKVTNTWVNRLIGDAQPGVTNKITFTTMPFYKPDSPLLPSGLLGPVKLIARSALSDK